MKKKNKKKTKKFNFIRFFKFLLFLACFIIMYIYFSKQPIKNIVIKGNNYLTDEEIIETAKIENYPSFLKTFTFIIEGRLKKLDLVKSVKVKKRWYYRLIIEIEEERILFKNRSTNEYILSKDKRINEIKNDEEVPILINFVSDDIMNKMIEKFNLLDNDVIKKISEIEYAPNDYDNERFIFYMNDENVVYVTLTKIKEFNKYNKIKEQLGNNKGILYLDSGNYFEIKN